MPMKIEKQQILTDDLKVGNTIDIGGAFYKINEKQVNDYGNWVLTLGDSLGPSDWEIVLIMPSRHGIEIITEWGGFHLSV